MVKISDGVSLDFTERTLILDHFIILPPKSYYTTLKQEPPFDPLVMDGTLISLEILSVITLTKMFKLYWHEHLLIFFTWHVFTCTFDPKVCLVSIHAPCQVIIVCYMVANVWLVFSNNQIWNAVTVLFFGTFGEIRNWETAVSSVLLTFISNQQTPVCKRI